MILRANKRTSIFIPFFVAMEMHIYLLYILFFTSITAGGKVLLFKEKSLSLISVSRQVVSISNPVTILLQEELLLLRAIRTR